MVTQPAGSSNSTCLITGEEMEVEQNILTKNTELQLLETKCVALLCASIKMVEVLYNYKLK